MFGREKIAMVVAEFIGTFSLVSVVLAMIGRTNFPFFAAAAAGATFGLMTLLVGAASGAHLNPAVTIGMWTLKRIETVKALIYIAAQMFGGFVAWTLSEYLLNQSLRNIANSSFDWRVLTAEAVGAALFTFGVAATLLQGYRGLRQAFAVGGSLALGIVIASFGGNGLINPAVALGVQSWSFAYVAGPVLGAIVGMNLYAFLFAGQPLRVRAKAAKTSPAKRSTVRKVLGRKRK
jgi:glycerol uptake facilitator-like aquaporin